MTYPSLFVVFAVGGLACSSSSAKKDSRLGPKEPTRVEVSWAKSVSLLDVLEPAKSNSLGPTTAVGINPRGREAAGPRPQGSDSPQYEVITSCGDRFCIDGLFFSAQHSPFGRLKLTESKPDTDDLEILNAGPNSWVDRGIKVHRADDETVSFYVAEASMTDGAAHSTAGFYCRTHLRRGLGVTGVGDDSKVRTQMMVPARLDGLIGSGNAGLVLDAVARFLETESAEGEPRASHLKDVDAFSYVIDKPNEFLFCIEYSVEASSGHAQLVRARLKS